MFIKDIKAVFPDAKFVSIEEDVALLSYKRKKEKEKRLLKKWIAGLRFKKLENAEVDALASSDLIILNNEKDSKLLEQYNILKGKKIKVWAPYYDSYVKYKRGEIYEHSMIYYGAMNRPENYLSVIWFIDKVLPLFDQEFEYKFYVVGGKPDRRLLSYESDKIVITGFVEDVSEYFSKVGCLVAPLVLGAGIKIKILEALSAGIPVLTNSIGIEGIPAEPNKEYFHCEMPEDYSGVIQKLFRGEYDNRQIEDDEKKFVSTHFNYEKSADDFIKWIRSICLYE